jgi:hypothetical protein
MREGAWGVGPMTCVVIPWFADRLLERTFWQAMA